MTLRGDLEMIWSSVRSIAAKIFLLRKQNGWNPALGSSLGFGSELWSDVYDLQQLLSDRLAAVGQSLELNRDDDLVLALHLQVHGSLTDCLVHDDDTHQVRSRSWSLNPNHHVVEISSSNFH